MRLLYPTHSYRVNTATILFSYAEGSSITKKYGQSACKYLVGLGILRPMKRKTRNPETPSPVKTSISLPDVLMRFAEERIHAEGHNSFSAYVAHLVRLDKAGVESRQSKPGTPSTAAHDARYPEHAAGYGYATTEDKTSSGPSADTHRKMRAAVKKVLPKLKGGAPEGSATNP
jgi:hypothetical protein